jgi:hypothetical protein
VSNNDDDPALRQALFYQQTIEDTIDISDTGKLYGQFQQSSSVGQAVAGFRSAIGTVTSVSQLVNNPQLLSFSLTAFGIDPTAVTSDTVQAILGEGATAQASDPLLRSDPRFQQFAQAFSGLAGGAPLSQSGIDAVVAGYQTNAFAQALSSGGQASNTATFGNSGASAIGSLLADFQSTSGVSQSIAYYQQNIGKVTTADQLVNDPQLLNVALGSFNLSTQTVPASVARQLIVDDPNAPASVQAQANALLLSDPDAARFAQAFGALAPGGQSQLAKVGGLYQQFAQQASVQQAVSHFQSAIGSVTTVSGLLGDPQLLNVALTAFNIDPASVSSTTLNQILTETPVQQASDPLLAADPRFAAFAQDFGSLNSDGGQALHQQSSITSVVTAYQANRFAQTLATNDISANIAAFGPLGAATATAAVTAIQSSNAVSQAVGFYQSNIGSVRSVSDLVGNSQLLTVALGAFGISAAGVPATTISQLLSETPAQQAADPLVTEDPRFAAFVQAFGSLNSDHGTQIHSASSVTAVVAGFQTNQVQQALTTQVQQVISNPVLASPSTAAIGSAGGIAAITGAFQANQFRQSIVANVQQVTANSGAGSLTTMQLLGNATLSAVTLGALGLPAQTGALDPDQQVRVIENAGFDPKKLLDRSFLDKFIQQFLVNTGMQQSSAGGSDPGSLALSILSGGSGSDSVPSLDLSFLANGSSVNLLA